MTREDPADQSPAPLGQRDRDEATVVTPPLLLDETAPHEVAHDDGGVAVAAEQLLPEVALAERPVMQQRLEHAELPDREPRGRHHVAHARGDRLGRAHQLDVRVEDRRLGRSAAIARGHSSNLNGLYAAALALSSTAARTMRGA